MVIELMTQRKQACSYTSNTTKTCLHLDRSSLSWPSYSVQHPPYTDRGYFHIPTVPCCVPACRFLSRVCMMLLVSLLRALSWRTHNTTQSHSQNSAGTIGERQCGAVCLDDHQAVRNCCLLSSCKVVMCSCHSSCILLGQAMATSIHTESVPKHLLALPVQGHPDCAVVHCCLQGAAHQSLHPHNLHASHRCTCGIWGLCSTGRTQCIPALVSSEKGEQMHQLLAGKIGLAQPP